MWVNPDLKIREDISKKGLPFVEYTYGKVYCNSSVNSVYIKNSVNKYRTYSSEEFKVHTESPSLASLMSQGFHLIFIGLDRSSFSVKDLIQEL